MRLAARSVFFFGIYLIVLGSTLLTRPNVILGIFGVPLTAGVWVRIVGMLLVLNN
jgi:hypothetical protein